MLLLSHESWEKTQIYNYNSVFTVMKVSPLAEVEYTNRIFGFIWSYNDITPWLEPGLACIWGYKKTEQAPLFAISENGGGGYWYRKLIIRPISAVLSHPKPYFPLLVIRNYFLQALTVEFVPILKLSF